MPEKMKVSFRPAWLTRPVVISATICLLLAPVFSLIQQAFLIGIGAFLQSLALSTLLKNALVSLGLDPVYASVLNRTMGNIEARGLAVAPPLGDLLHQAAPLVFAPSDRVVAGAWATALVGDGASLLASAIATIGAESVFILVGLALFWLSLRRGHVSARVTSSTMWLVGLMLQARGVAGLLNLRFSPEDLEIMGLSHVFTKIVPMDSGSYGQMVDDPAAGAVAALFSLVPILLIYGSVLVVLMVRKRGLPGGVKTSWRRLAGSHPVLWPRAWSMLRSDPARLGAAGSLAVALLVGTTVSQALFPAQANYNYPSPTEESTPIAASIPEEPAPVVVEPPTRPVALDAAASRPPVKTGPSKVYVTGKQNVFSYVVDGMPMKLRGVGYNPMYTSLPSAERASRYDRDFGQMQASGVNTVLGWEKEQFDELTLQKAQEHGIGVIIPYYLPREGDYGNPAYDQEVQQDVRDWVQRFRGFPAVRMWGIGNEVIHGMGRNPDTPKARAFASFYMKLADMVHDLDPDHPVTYRDAEDLYLNPIREIINTEPGRRPWFVYGMNVFTTRLCQIADDWPKRNMDVAAIVSEFAPSGLSPADRPKGYINMMRCVARTYPSVLGGFAYVWFSNGPEAIDRVMGLVDGDGRPVDRSLYLLGRAYRNEPDLFDDNLLRIQ